MKIKTVKFSINGLAYFVFSILVLTDKFWGYEINSNYKYVIALPWVMWFLITIYKKQNEKAFCCRKIFIVYAFPILIMFFYALLIWLFKSDVRLDNYFKLFRTVIKIFIAWGYVCAGYYKFKEKSIDILFAAACASYFFGSVICLLKENGLSGFTLYVRSLINSGYSDADKIMEVHGLTFAAGIFALYYIYYENKNVKNHYLKIVLSVLLIFLGLKRIEILALIITGASSIILVRRGKDIKYRSVFFMVIFLIISFTFLYVVDSGLLSILATKYKINTMGRIGYYSFSKQYFRFSPSFLGTGYTFFSYVFSKLYESGYRINGNLISASLHSDILVFYIENGFWLFIAWVVYTFNIQTRYIQKKVGSLAAEAYLLVAVFMFILYLTDNTFTYFDTEAISFLVPLVLSTKKTIKDIKK